MSDLQAHPSNLRTERLPLAVLKPHPRNYRAHGADQIAHLCRSLTAHGCYRPVVIAQDNTILAGHGVALAAAQLGWNEVEVVRLPVAFDSPAALSVLTGDNEIEHLAEQDDRALTELLKELAAVDVDALLGTGYDEAMLANLVFVTRPASEIADHDAAEHWVGMPDAGEPMRELKLVVNFASEAEREQFLTSLGVEEIRAKHLDTWSIWWPLREREDVLSVQFAEAVGE